MWLAPPPSLAEPSASAVAAASAAAMLHWLRLWLHVQPRRLAPGHRLAARPRLNAHTSTNAEPSPSTSPVKNVTHLLSILAAHHQAHTQAPHPRTSPRRAPVHVPWAPRPPPQPTPPPTPSPARAHPPSSQARPLPCCPCGAHLDLRVAHAVARRHLLVELRDGSVERGVAVLLVHVVVASARLVPHPDAVVLHGRGLALKDLRADVCGCNCVCAVSVSVCVCVQLLT